ncbi:MAG: diadenylate cyclase CdaA [Bacteroidales bacterium]|nr:diadenylate cyclase CdaA [Candidatus Cacconaster caballi]
MLDFLHLYFTDILDIVLVALLFFWLIRLVRGTAAGGIFTVVAMLYVVWVVTRALKMQLISFLLGQVLGVGVIALFIIFQPEIRRFLIGISSRYLKQKNIFSRLFRHSNAGGISAEALEELTAACQNMSETKTGALIVMPHSGNVQDIIDTGDTISARINRRLIENIFFKNTPLHDGAMIMSRSEIIAARCTLPITDRQDIPPRYGMRHRAAIGVTEHTDATVVVVSEETGEISFVSRGEIKTMGSITELRIAVENSYK